MSRKLLTILLIFLMLLIALPVFAEKTLDEIQSLIPDVIEGILDPGDLTNRMLIVEYDEYDNPTYMSILKDEWEDIPFGRLQSIKRSYIQPDYVRYKSSGSISWGTERTGANNLKKEIGNGHEVIVAVLDTGVDHTHPFLKDRIVEGFNFVNNNNNTIDVDGHGTHCAGIIADSTNNNVKIMPVKVLDDNGQGYDSDIVKGIRYAVDRGVHIISMSLGGPGHSPAMKEAIEYALSKNVLVVVAAGNDSADTKDFYPASEEKAIVVSAVDQYDQLADFSNYGKSVDISAPGVDIYSSFPQGNYANLSGTSMATPYVSGISAMLKSADIQIDVRELEELLKIYTDDLGPIGRDDYYGEGLINVSNYKQAMGDFELVSPADNSTHFNSIAIKYFANNLIGSSLNVFVDEKQVFTKLISKNGYFEDTIDITEITKDSISLTIQIVKNNVIVHTKRLDLNISQYNTFISAYNMNNIKQDNFTAHIYYVKDVGDMGIEHINKVNVYDGTLKLNIDYDNILEEYEHIVVVIYRKDDLDLPIYLTELHEAGLYVLKPIDLQKITVSTDFEDLYRLSLHFLPKFKDSKFKSISWLYDLYLQETNPISFYVSKGNHILNFMDSKYSATTVLDGRENANVLYINKNNTGKLNFISEEGLGRIFDGEDHRSVYIYHEDSLNNNQAGFSLMKGDNYHTLPYGTYYIGVDHVLNGIEYNTYRKVIVNSSNKNLTFKYDSKFNDFYKLNVKQSNSLNGKLEMKDKYGNVFITGWRFPLDYGYQSLIYKTLNKNSVNDVNNDGEKEFVSQNNYDVNDYYWLDIKIYLKNKHDGKIYSTNLDSLWEFEFDEHIPNGQYELYTDYQKGEYEFIHEILQVEVKDNQFFEIEPPVDYSEYKLINSFLNVKSDKIWTIKFNRNYDKEEIKAIKILETDKEIEILTDFNENDTHIIVKPVYKYKTDTQYILLVELANGSKYRLEFTTSK